MTLLKVILQIGILYGFFLLGNSLKNLLDLPIPGSILGLLLLWTALMSKLLPVKFVRQGSGYLLAILPLLLIPPTLGIMNYPSLFIGKGIFIFIMVILSTVFTILITAKTCQILEERSGKRKESKVCSKSLSH